jgi:hypothetical protein
VILPENNMLRTTSPWFFKAAILPLHLQIKVGKDLQ